ncbi:MAG: hypothetical protein C4547_06520 [Phycisphaerales bacterium]|nr:MAG: hypothetical protein C4547_06520 [Phycisphaerales bacterium]
MGEGGADLGASVPAHACAGEANGVGFASGCVTFRRFFLTGDHPSAAEAEWLEPVRLHAFGRNGVAGIDGIETGWIRPTHLFDVKFDDLDALRVGRFVYLAMRLDRTAPPAAIVRSYRLQEEAAALEASGRDFLSKAERRQAREAAEARAEEEARDGAFRRTAAFSVLFDPGDGVCYLGNTSNKVAEKFMELVSDTFKLTLAPATPGELGLRLAERAGLADAWDQVKPSYLCDPPQSDAELEFDPGRDYLGREFLLWLWYRCADDEGEVALSGATDVQIAIQKTLQMACPWDVTGRTAVRRDDPSAAPEARAALAIGKFPTRMGLMVAARADEWALTLDGRTAGVSSAALPASDEKDKDAWLEERFMRLRELSRILDGLYGEFIRRRLAASWRGEWDGISRWAMHRNGPTSSAAPKLATA